MKTTILSVATYKKVLAKTTVFAATLGMGLFMGGNVFAEGAKSAGDENKVKHVEKAPFGNAANGKAKSATCAACHGSDGNSTNAEWPNIAGQSAEYLFEQLKLIKSGERVAPLMVGQLDNKSEQDLKDMAAHFSAQTPKLGNKLDEDLAKLGQKIYRGGNVETGVPACAACHGVTAAGIPMSKYPNIEGQQPKYLVKSLNDYASGKRSGNANQKIMKEIAGAMSDEEIAAVSAYIHALQ